MSAFDKNKKLPFEDEAVLQYFLEHISSGEEGKVTVPKDEKDYELDVQTLFIYPHIPDRELANAQHRFDLINYYDGLFLCLFYNVSPNKRLADELCILTTKKLFYYHTAEKRMHRLNYNEIERVEVTEDYPCRGLRVVLKNKERIIMAMPFHELILSALATFMSTVDSKLIAHSIDINNASIRVLMTLSVITERRAKYILEQRECLCGFNNFTQFVACLGFGPDEAETLESRVVFNPLLKTEKQGRAVDF